MKNILFHLKKFLLIIFFPLILINIQNCSVKQNVISGKVIRVLDGDTIEILVDNNPIKIRFYAIDTPERKQAYGSVAKDFTVKYSFKKNVKVIVHDKDRYGRLIGEIILPDGKNLNHELLKAGLAWWYRHYSDDVNLLEMELEARKQQKGLWKDINPVAPWDYRREQRNKKKDSSFIGYIFYNTKTVLI